jgi:GTP cyclohydrolase IA
MNILKAEALFKKLMEQGLGLDLTDPNLVDTPKRFVKMIATEFMANASTNEDELINIVKSFPNEKKFDEIIMLDNIPFVSTCSHHLLPFPGVAWLLYVPDKKLMGASKAARIINFFSKKLQLQENLSTEVINAVMTHIEPLGAMLVMRAVHGCMSCRGVKTGSDAGMTTSATRGCFRDNMDTRIEALELIKLSAFLQK